MAAYHSRTQKAPIDAQDAAVLLLLYPSQSIATVFIERRKHELDKHSGQISFPGGKVEKHDKSYSDCALREASEEIGVEPSLVEVVGHLTPLYIPVSNFKVYPVVGVAEQPLQFMAQADEVSKIITAPLSIFDKSSTRKKKDILIRSSFTLQGVPYFDVEGKVVWGATAMILNEFLAILQSYKPSK